MPAATSIAWAAAALAAGAAGAKKISDDNISTQKRMANEQLKTMQDQQVETEKKFEDQGQKEQISTEMQQARMRQRQQRARYAGRTSTILTEPLGGAPAPQAGGQAGAPGQRTLLGV